MKLVMDERDKSRLLNYYIAPTTRGHKYVYDGIKKLHGNSKLKQELMDMVQAQTQSLEGLYELIERSTSTEFSKSVIPVYENIEVKD